MTWVEVLKVEERWRSAGHMTKMSKNSQQKKLRMNFLFFSSSWNPRERGKMQHVLSGSEQRSGLFPRFVQIHAMAHWCLEGQCNWLLEESVSWEMALCLPLWYLWHRKSFLLQNRWHLRQEKTTCTVSNTAISTVVYYRWVGCNNHTDIIIRLRSPLEVDAR